MNIKAASSNVSSEKQRSFAFFWYLHRLNLTSRPVYFTLQLSTTDITPPNDSEGTSKPAASGEAQSDEEAVSPAERSLLQKIIRKGLVENKNDIEIQRKDPTSPLYSVKSFEALHL